MNTSGQIAIKGSNASSSRSTRLFSDESNVGMGSNKGFKMDIPVRLNHSVTTTGTTSGVSMERILAGRVGYQLHQDKLTRMFLLLSAPLSRERAAQALELLLPQTKFSHDMFARVLPPQSLLREPSYQQQPMVWSTLPETSSVRRHQGLDNSARRSLEMVAVSIGCGPEMWHSGSLTNHANLLTRGMDLVVRSPTMMPFVLSSPNDGLLLSPRQAFLRLNIEAFSATALDAVVRIKGRNKALHLHQVGLRCRHCAHVPTMQKSKGAVYFPSSTLGLYQAAQNMCSSHLQCGQCPDMPESIKTLFGQLLETKTTMSHSASGRTYWAQCAQQEGLVDTELGIFPVGM
jgi:hypothetical protein